MFRSTGPGKAGIYPDPHYFDLILYNFDVEGFAVKHYHQDILDLMIIPKILDGWTFIIQGTASLTGARNFDLRLSHQRALAVGNYIEKKLQRSLGNIIVEALGKDNPIGKMREDDLDRAVRLYGWDHPSPPPQPKPRPIAPPQPIAEIGPYIPPATDGPSLQFFIKMTGGISVGPGVAQGEWQRFLIWDKIHAKAAYFDRRAAGVGLPTPLPGSFTREGEFNSFILKRPLNPMSLMDFDGVPVILTSGGTGDVGRTSLTIKPFGVTDSRQIDIDPFRTGFTFGFSYKSGSVGLLSMDKGRGIFDRKEE